MATSCTAANCRRLRERLRVYCVLDFSEPKNSGLFPRSFSAALDLGAPDRWEPPHFSRRCLPCVDLRSCDSASGRALRWRPLWRLLAGRHSADGRSADPCGFNRISSGSDQSALECEESVLAACSLTPWQISSARQPSCGFCGPADCARTDYSAFLDFAPRRLARISTGFWLPLRGCCWAGR